MASRVIALVEHPATRSRAGAKGAVTAAGPAD
jgi:hypothetical protein